MATSLVAVCLSVLSSAGIAGAVLTKDEEEVLLWSWQDEWRRVDEPAIGYAHQLRRMLYTEDRVRRQLMLDRCGMQAVYVNADLANERYLQVVTDATTAVQSWLAPKSYRERPLEKPLAALIFAYRKADQPTKDRWQAYMRTEEAKEAYRWVAKVDIADVFYERYGFDATTGRVRTAWIHWFHQYLSLAGLLDAYLSASNGVQPGLGAEFDALARAPLVWPYDRAWRARLDRTSESLHVGIESGKIGDALVRLLPERALRLMLAWDDQAIVQAQQAAARRISKASMLPYYVFPGRKTPPSSSTDPEMELFLLEVQGDRDEVIQRDEDVRKVIKSAVAGKCAVLK